jgi:hypothetical protein
MALKKLISHIVILALTRKGVGRMAVIKSRNLAKFRRKILKF